DERGRDDEVDAGAKRGLEDHLHRLGGDDRRVVTQEAVLVVVALLGRRRGERFGAFGPVEKTFAGGLAPAAEQILVVDEPAAITEARRAGLDALRGGGEVGERR